MVTFDRVNCPISKLLKSEHVQRRVNGLCVSDKKVGEVERGVQKLELTGKGAVQMRAGSEINLASAVKQNKRTSFRQSLAVCTERAQVGKTLTTHPVCE